MDNNNENHPQVPPLAPNGVVLVNGAPGQLVPENHQNPPLVNGAQGQLVPENHQNPPLVNGAQGQLVPENHQNPPLVNGAQGQLVPENHQNPLPVNHRQVPVPYHCVLHPCDFASDHFHTFQEHYQGHHQVHDDRQLADLLIATLQAHDNQVNGQ